MASPPSSAARSPPKLSPGRRITVAARRWSGSNNQPRIRLSSKHGERGYLRLVLLGPPLIALVMIGILALYPLRATVHLPYYVSATNTFAFWSLALNLSLWGLQSHFWATHVYLPAWWRRAALPAAALNRLATNRSKGEQIAAVVSLITINACLLVLSSFMAWRAQGLIIIVVNNLLFIAVEQKTGRMRQLLLQSSRAQDALESLARRTLFYLIFQMCAFVLNLVESMDSRYSNLHFPVTVRYAEALGPSKEIAEFCGPTAHNASYVAAYCPTQDAIRFENRHSWGSGCDDGGFDLYPSLMDACLASRRVETELAVHIAACSLGIRCLFLFMDDVWEFALDPVWRRKMRLANFAIRRTLYFLTLLEALNALGQRFSILSYLIASNHTLHVSYALYFAQVLINCVPRITILKKQLQEHLDIRSNSRHDQRDAVTGTHGTTRKHEKRQQDVFLSHNWGPNADNRDNHQRVCTIATGLRARGIECWLDQVMMDDDLSNQMSQGIDECRLVAVFITDAYMRKVQGLGPRGLDDNCKSEFDYALRRRGVAKVVPIVMESGCKNPDEWQGAVGFRLGSQLYLDLSEGDPLPSEETLDLLAQHIRKRLDVTLEKQNKVRTLLTNFVNSPSFPSSRVSTSKPQSTGSTRAGSKNDLGRELSTNSAVSEVEKSIREAMSRESSSTSAPPPSPRSSSMHSLVRASSVLTASDGAEAKV